MILYEYNLSKLMLQLFVYHEYRQNTKRYSFLAMDETVKFCLTTTGTNKCYGVPIPEG